MAARRASLTAVLTISENPHDTPARLLFQCGPWFVLEAGSLDRRRDHQPSVRATRSTSARPSGGGRRSALRRFGGVPQANEGSAVTSSCGGGCRVMRSVRAPQSPASRRLGRHLWRGDCQHSHVSGPRCVCSPPAVRSPDSGRCCDGSDANLARADRHCGGVHSGTQSQASRTWPLRPWAPL